MSKNSKAAIIVLLCFLFVFVSAFFVADHYRLFEAHNFGIETTYDNRVGDAFDDERAFKMLMVCSGFTIDDDHVFCFITTYRKGDVDEANTGS